MTSLLMPDTDIRESQNSDVKRERNRRLQQWQLKRACSHLCDVNELPWDHTAKTPNAETHLKTSHLQGRYNYFSWRDCNALSLLCRRNTKLFRTCSVLPKTGQQQCASNEGTKGKVAVWWQDGCKGGLEYSTHLSIASLHRERKRTRALILLSNLDSFSPFTGSLMVFLSNQKKWEPRGTLNLSCSKQPTAPRSPFKKQQMYCAH